MRHVHHLLVSALCALPASAPALADEAADRLDGYVLIVFGDSLTAGFGLSEDQALPASLDRALAERGLDGVDVRNAGVSGDTSASGLARFDFSIGGEADGVLIALGGNDALQGRPPAELEANLAEMIARARGREIDVLLAGMRAPRNLGAAYAEEFDAVYADLARETSTPLYPFLLEPVALRVELLMADGVHPTAEGVTAMAEPLADFVADALRAAEPE